MLRIERIFESEAIEEELEAYNPLIPDGSNFKATFMIEFPDVEERRKALVRFAGIEDDLYLEVDGVGRVAGVAEEEVEGTEQGKTSAVHFVRVGLAPEMKDAIKRGASFKFGCEHPEYRYETVVSDKTAESLRRDLD